jgi:CRAL/TRIO domain
MALIKPLLKPEVAARLQFHSSDYETLYNFVPRRVLPYEYGGEAGSISEMKEFWMKRLIEKRSIAFYLIKVFIQYSFLYFNTCRDYLKNDANWIAAKCDDSNNNYYG